MTILSAMVTDIDAKTLAKLVEKVDPFRKTIIVDCRSFIDYNLLHIRYAINAFYSKMMRRRVYDNKICSSVMLSQIGEEKCCNSTLVDLVLYSESDESIGKLSLANNYPTVLTSNFKRKYSSNTEKHSDDSPQKLLRTLQEKFTSSKRFHKVLVLRDGFDDFRNRFPELCESSTERHGNPDKSIMGNHILTSISQPCLSNVNDGPTQILPFLYLGSQTDAMDSGILSKYGIKYVINLSVNCPKPDTLEQQDHFMRIPVNDTYQAKLLPHFDDAFKFLDEVCERGSVALVHCLAGISRSPTLAIAYMMRRNNWTSEQAYRYVKERRPSISPNFNFMGQLLEYEARLRERNSPSISSISNCSNTVFSSSICTLSSVSDSDSSSDPNPIKECDNTANVSKLGKSISCDTLPCKVSSFKAANFWDNDCSVPSSKTNENGKRVMETACPHLLDRPRVLDGLKSRKALNVPQKVDEDLPSPSTELQKLSFNHSSETSSSASNPFFLGRTHFEKSTSAFMDPTVPSTSRMGHYSAENLTFNSCDHLSMSFTSSFGICNRSRSHRTTMGHKFLTRLSHYLRKGTCHVEHGRCVAADSTAGRKSVITSISSVIPSNSASSTYHDNNLSLSNSGPVAAVRSRSVNSLDKTHKRATGSTATRALQILRRRRIMDHQQRDRSHFVATTTITADSSGNSSNNNCSNKSEAIIESSAKFREPDRDSINSASSLEILVQ